MSDQIDDYVKRPIRYGNIDGLDELLAGVVLAGRFSALVAPGRHNFTLHLARRIDTPCLYGLFHARSGVRSETPEEANHLSAHRLREVSASHKRRLEDCGGRALGACCCPCHCLSIAPLPNPFLQDNGNCVDVGSMGRNVCHPHPDGRGLEVGGAGGADCRPSGSRHASAQSLTVGHIYSGGSDFHRVRRDRSNSLSPAKSSSGTGGGMNEQAKSISMLDRVIHEPGRLMIVALLSAVYRINRVFG
jgi:hypothetical protein